VKIFHCLRNFLPDSVGGTEVYVAALCKSLQVLGVEVAVVKPCFRKEPQTYFYDGIKVIEYLETSTPDVLLQTGMVPPEGLNNFKHLLLQETPNALHFHESAGSNGITIFHLLAAKETQIPLFTTFHLSGNICMRDNFLFKGKYDCNGTINPYKCSVCMLQKKGLPFLMPELLSFLGIRFKQNISINRIAKVFNYPLYIKKHKERLLKVDLCSERIFVLSNWFKVLLVNNGINKNRIVVLPAVIPSKGTASIEVKNSLFQGSKVRFVYIGRIARIKGLHILLKAVLNLNQKNWELDIYGSVSEPEYYDLCKSKSEGHTSIHWKGELLHNDVINTLSNYDALIFPSIVQETMGMVILEAFAAKIPVIGSSIWSVNEHIIDGKNGFLFKIGDPYALKLIIEKILGEPSLLQTMVSIIASPLYMDAAAKPILLEYKKVLDSSSVQ
jgi:glycosyltransferase involved in cell wall biosynthesis